MQKLNTIKQRCISSIITNVHNNTYRILHRSNIKNVLSSNIYGPYLQYAAHKDTNVVCYKCLTVKKCSECIEFKICINHRPYTYVCLSCNEKS